MKNIYKLRMAVVACSVLAATACTDYLDYNTVPEATDPAADKTLWENIVENDNLTDFAGVLERMGYDKVLNASRTYTVWAPVNGSYSVEELNQMDTAQVVRQFLKNMIADYAHRETDINDTVVYMLNGKLMKFSNKNTGDLAFDGQKILRNTSNLEVFNYPSTNGLLYVAAAPAVFRYNGYEYLRESEDMPNMMWNYVDRYHSSVLDEANSVKGTIIDGVQHYDDSVMIVSNTLTERRLRAQLDNEDSLYSVILLTDDAWENAYKEISSYYNYSSSMVYQDLNHATVGNEKAEDLKQSTGSVTVTLEAAPNDQKTEEYWTDSITKLLMTQNMVFSETNQKYNAKLLTNTDFAEKDTLYSTTGNYLTNLLPLNDVTDKIVRLSNGHARFVNEFPFLPEETYAPVIRSREVARLVLQDRVGQATRVSIEEKYLDPEVCVLEDNQTSLIYVRADIPNLSEWAPELDFYLSGVLSTTYDAYAVVVPSCVENPEMADSLKKPYTLHFDINYTGADNKPVMARFNGDTIIVGSRNMKNVDPFVVGRDKVDTVKLGRLTFPVCYAGTDAKPNIKVFHSVSSFSSQKNKDSYEQKLRIANIILEPVR